LSASFLVSFISIAQDRSITLSKVDSLIEEARYAEALRYIDGLGKDTNASHALGFIENKRAEILITQGNLKEANAILDKIRASDQFIHAITLSNKGFVSLNQGRYDLAIKNLTEGLAGFQATEQTLSREAIQCLTHLSSVYLSTGRYKQAEENELLALQLRQTLFGNTSEGVAASYNNLGLIYLSTDPAKSLEYYEKSLRVYTVLHPVEHPKIAISNTNLGIAYVQLGLYGNAINHFEEARKIWEKIYPDGHPNNALVLRNLGRTYAKLNDQKTSIAYYQKSIAMYEKSYGVRHPDIASTLNELATIQLNANAHPLALEYVQKSLLANTQNFNSSDFIENPDASDYYNPTVLVYSLNLKAKILEARYGAKTLRLEDLRLALRCLYTCDSLIDNIRHKHAEESDKLTLGTLANEVYEDGVRLAVLLSENVLHATPYLEVAFYFAEKSKASVLLASIVDAHAKSFAGIPPELLEQERSIKSTIMQLNQQLEQKPDPEVEKVLRKKLFDTNNQYYQFINKLEQEYPHYYNLKYSQRTTNIQDLQNTLDEQTAILSYFIADSSKTLYTFNLTQHKFTVATRSLTPDFYRYLRGLKNSIVFSEPNTFNKTSLWLSELLLPRLSPNIEKLIIIPSGKLSTLPFEVLLTKKSKRIDFLQAAFLVNKFSISYEFAASLILQKGKHTPVTNPSIFLCAPVIFREGLADLPGTEKEVTQIAALFNTHSKIALNSLATEGAVKSGSLSGFDYLHFATHGTADELDPGLSRLFLNASDTEDGNLYAGEIYNLNLHARLAVLSACETGLGRLSKGEGVIGLSRALIYAGAENIVVSFWNVADESTASLMENFYTTLLTTKQVSFSEALRSSKLKMIRTQTYSAPYFWAPFILVGQ
jgi:CHAT domain-containing protein